MPANPISDIDLDAYVDDQLDAQRRIEVEEYLSRHPEEAMRVMADLRTRDALRLAFTESAAREAPTETQALLAQRLQYSLRRGRVLEHLRQATAAAVLFGIGWAGHVGFVRFSPASEVALAATTFVDQAITAHRTSQLRAGMLSQPHVAHLNTEDILRTIGIPMPAVPSDWKVLDVQVFPSAAGPSVEVVMRAGNLGPLSVFATKTTRQLDITGRASSRQGDAGVVYWQKGEWAYAVIGEQADTELDHAAGQLTVAMSTTYQ